LSLSDWVKVLKLEQQMLRHVRLQKEDFVQLGWDIKSLSVGLGISASDLSELYGLTEDSVGVGYASGVAHRRQHLSRKQLAVASRDREARIGRTS